MRLKQIACAAAFGSLLTCASLVAQSDDSRKPDPYIDRYVSKGMLSTIPNKPYVLERELTRTGKLFVPGFNPPGAADAAPQPLVERIKQCRDSRGWIREDTFDPQPVADEPVYKPRMIKIYDADARKDYIAMVMNLQTGKPSWTMVPIPTNAFAPTDVRFSPAGISGSPANGTAGRGEVIWQTITVSLGNDTMLGLPVIGIRQTGSRASTGEKFEIEGWFSPDLQLPILVKSDDARSGHVERRVTKLDRVEPDASLFIPPTDYQTANVKPPTPTPPAPAQ